MEMKRLSRLILGVICCLAVIAAEASAGGMKPLCVSQNGHFLIEEGGKPFLILADTAWALFSGISREDVRLYLDDRKAKGFNTILCSLLHFWPAPAPAGRPNEQGERAPGHRVYGFWAFDGNHYDLTRPNRQYWEHVDWVIRQAEERSLRLAIVPCRFRSAGDTWKEPLTNAAAAKFGEYLGIRCCNYNNIIWLFGGDYPPAQDVRRLRLMAEAIRYYAPQHLISCDTSNNGASSSGEFAHAERWLAFNSVQTRGTEYPAGYALVQKDWHRVPAKPTWLAEPHYERPANRLAVRQAAWRSVLGGGAGFGYGVDDVFNLGSSGAGLKYPMYMPGCSDVVRMLELLESQPWQKLIPDHAAKDRLLAGVETPTDVYFPSACSSDGDFGVVYLPVRATILVDMGKFKGPVIGRWFSPASGASEVAEGSPFINGGVRTVKPPESTDTTDADFVLVLTVGDAAQVESTQKTQLGIEGEKFTINGKPAFLLGISYYGALGASRMFINRDLNDMQARRINWIRVWATWSAYDNDISAVDEQGKGREPYLSRLKWLVGECDRCGMVVDVTLSRGDGTVGPPRLQTLETHKRAVETLATELKAYRNWYLDLGNERNITDKRFVSMNEVKELRDAARQIDANRLVTASRAGDIPQLELREYLATARVDFISPHRPRSSESAKQTAEKSREYRTWMKEIGAAVPLHYQEPFRRGFTTGWEPTVEDFVMDAKGALEGGAAGWCLHNGDQQDKPESKPRRSFDMREQRLFDQLDEIEKEALQRLSQLFQGR